MVDVASPASLYPQPPAPNQGLLGGNPLQIIGAVGQLNANKLFQAEFAARQAQGRAAQSAIGPDGTYNPIADRNALAADPNAAFGAGDAIQGTLQRQGAGINNNNAQLLHATSLFGALSNLDKPTPLDVHNLKATIAATMPGIPPEVINNLGDSILKDPQGIKHGAAFLQNIAIGPAGVATRTTAPPGPGGVPQSAPLGTINLAGGATPVGQAPGVGTAAETAGGASGQLLAADRLRGSTFRREAYPLEQAIPALEKLGTTGTGPGTTELNNIKSFLQSAGIPGIDASKIKNFDEAQKYLTDFVNQTGNSGTNDKLAAAFAGNPSTKISNAAAVDVAKAALSLRRMDQAKLLEFQKTGLGPDQYADWAAKWVTKQDPRAFGIDLMKSGDVQKMIGSLKGKERENFIASLRAAHENGLVTPPAGQ